MKKRIRKNQFGEYVAEFGLEVKSQPNPFGRIGYLMPAFIVYQSSVYDTKEAAEAAEYRE